MPNFELESLTDSTTYITCSVLLSLLRAQALNLALTSVFVSEICREIQNSVSSKHFYLMLLKYSIFKYLKNYKDFESNQYYIENHYQNATKNQKGNFKFLKFHGFLDAFLKN